MHCAQNNSQLTVRCKIRYTAHSITLDLDVRTQHLSDQRLQAAELDYLQLVLRYADVGFILRAG